MGEASDEPGRARSAETFDEAFARIAEAPRTQALFGEVLGPFPPGVEPFSLVPRAGLERVLSELRLERGGRLLDLCCGRGGVGLWFAASAGASVVGVDWSTVAIVDARRRASLFFPGVEGEFVVADATATRVAAGSVDAVVCVDALQLVPDKDGLLREAARVLRPGGRVVATTWERTGAEPERLPTDTGALIEGAGLSLLVREEQPVWLERQRVLYERAIADDGVVAEAAWHALADEGRSFLAQSAGVRRLLVVAASA